jgi:hypothetical protein
MRLTCTTCRTPADRRKKVRLYFENLCGIRLYRGVEGRKVYEAWCPSCKHTFSIDGGSDR